MTIPIWVKVLLAIERRFSRTASAAAIIRDEILLACLDSSQKEELNAFLYSRQQTYKPGGRIFEGGLFEWEKQAIEKSPFPASGRILLGGAGGGREIIALRDRGYEVVGFEPSEPLVMAAQAAITQKPGASLVRASYADLAKAVSGNGGPLASITTTRFDGVILGWGSFSHVLEDAARSELMDSISRLEPTAPVLLSFLPTDKVEGGTPGPTRRRFRRALALLGAPSARRSGYGLLGWGAFYRGFTETELTSLAARHGYTIPYLKMDPYPHAVLVPSR
ncbi:MAG: class I SAM-dependent methyltransferase [Gemmatimonadaceae bacterium]